MVDEKRDRALPSVFLFGSFSMWHSRTSLICTQGEETSFSYRGRSNERPEWVGGYNRQLLIATAEARVNGKEETLPARLGPVLMVGRRPLQANHEVTESWSCHARVGSGDR